MRLCELPIDVQRLAQHLLRASHDAFLDPRAADLARWPVVIDDGVPVAGVWTKQEPGSSTGELYIVAVHPHQQGTGLGRVVVSDALRALAAAGCETAELYVDENNVAAVALYRRAGFTVRRRHLCLQQAVTSLTGMSSECRQIAPATHVQ